MPAASCPWPSTHLLGTPFSRCRRRAVQVVWEVAVAPRRLLMAPFAQSHPSCGLGTNAFPPDHLMAKAHPTQGVYFSLELAGGGGRGLKGHGNP